MEDGWMLLLCAFQAASGHPAELMQRQLWSHRGHRNVSDRRPVCGGQSSAESHRSYSAHPGRGEIEFLASPSPLILFFFSQAIQFIVWIMSDGMAVSLCHKISRDGRWLIPGIDYQPHFKGIVTTADSSVRPQKAPLTSVSRSENVSMSTFFDKPIINLTFMLFTGIELAVTILHRSKSRFV